MVMLTTSVTPNWLQPIFKKYAEYTNKLSPYKTKFGIFLLIIIVSFTILKPQKMADVWLTRDQQGMVLFKLGYYQEAANHFNNTRWQAFALYGAEDWDNATILFGQFDSIADQFAKANATAHASRYVKARALYASILRQQPDNEAAQINHDILHEIIEANNRMSESQQPEQGDNPKDLGDEPQRGEGADKLEGRKTEIEQFNAEQLLLNPDLNQMWLRQVQKDPGRFLSQKFLMQLQKQEAPLTSEQGNE